VTCGLLVQSALDYFKGLAEQDFSESEDEGGYPADGEEEGCPADGEEEAEEYGLEVETEWVCSEFC